MNIPDVPRIWNAIIPITLNAIDRLGERLKKKVFPNTYSRSVVTRVRAPNGNVERRMDVETGLYTYIDKSFSLQPGKAEISAEFASTWSVKRQKLRTSI